MLIEYQLTIRNAADTADAITITSVRGGTNPYVSQVPTGDGSSFNPLTMESVIGEFTGQVADWPIGAAQRVLTSQLEDVNGYQQLGYRKATWWRRVNGGSFGVLITGVLTRLRLISSAEWAITVTDPQRAGIVQQLFSPSSSLDMLNGTTGFLDLWPNRGCLLGGPVMMPVVGGKPGSIFGIQDRGGWSMKVEATAIPGEYFLRPVTVYGPVNSWQPSNVISEELATAINQAANQFQSAQNDGSRSAWTTLKDTQTNYNVWPGLTVLIDSGSGFKPWKPLPYIYARAADDNGNPYPPPLVSPVKGSTGSGLHVIDDGVRALTNGALVKVRVLTVLPSDTCPIYLADNPVEVMKTVWTASKMAFDSSACTALKADPSLGASAYAAFRVTSSQGLNELLGSIQRPYGIAIRANTSGQLVPFQGRRLPNAPPTKTVTAANVVQGSTIVPFDLDPSQAVQSVVIRQKRFANAVNDMPGASPADEVRESDDELTFINGDTTAIPFGSFELSTDAMLHIASARYPVVEPFLRSIAQSIFDRFGHGAVSLETTLIRGTSVGSGTTDDVLLGDELLINLPELPNQGYRLGDNLAIAARAMQVVQLTEVDAGYRVRFVDSGPNKQPFVTVPTLSIAASSDSPRTVALITISNAATLNAAFAGVRLQWAVTTGAAPSAGDYTDAMSFAPGLVPTGSVRLSPVVAGGTVYVQGRSEGLSTARPSNYGSSAHLTLSAISNPTSVTATPSGSDASQCGLAWAIGSGATDCYSDIYLRLSGQTFDKAARVATVDPGSIAYALGGLIASTAYIASVQHRDPRTQDLSDAVDVAFTAGGTTRTLVTPLFPTAFSGARDKSFGIPVPTGAYGLAVVATEFPGFVEFAEAVETGVGSGAFGSFVTVGSVPSVAGDWTFLTRVAPNDGLRRQLKARHVADGCTSSAFTTAITVTPWTAFPLAPFGSNAQGTVTIDSNGAWQATADGTVSVQSWRYALSNSAFPTDATAAAGTAVAGRTFTVTGGPLTFGQTIYITAIPYSGTSGNGAAVGPSVHLRGAYQTFSSTVTTTYPPVGWTQGATTGPVLTRTSTPIVVSPAIPASGLVEGDFVGAAVAQGAALQSIDFVCAWNTAAHPLSQFVFSVLYTSGGFAFVTNGSPTYPGGLQTVHVNIGGSVPDSGKPIVFQALLFGPTSGSAAEAAQAELREVLVTTTAPNPAVRI